MLKLKDLGSESWVYKPSLGKEMEVLNTVAPYLFLGNLRVRKGTKEWPDPSHLLTRGSGSVKKLEVQEDLVLKDLEEANHDFPACKHCVREVQCGLVEWQTLPPYPLPILNDFNNFNHPEK